MTQTERNPGDGSRTTVARGSLAVLGAAAVLAGAGLLAGGCEADSYLDPSVIGRWEHTPTIVPILERIGSIEREDEDYVEVSDVTPEDLIPLPTEFVLGPGDTLEIAIRDFFRTGIEERLPRVIDKRGIVDIPRLPPIRIAGLTPTQARDAIVQTIQREGILTDPVVTVIPASIRQNTFSVFGAVVQPGSYFIPNADYRLLEALTAAGGFSEAVPEIFIIRQVALSEDVGGLPPATAPQSPAQPGQQRPEELIDLIDELSQPQGQPQPSPGMLSTSASRTGRRQPATPPVDLPEGSGPAQTAAAPSAPPGSRPGFNWVFLNGQWVRVQTPNQPAGIESGVSELTAEDLVTQRVIRVPTAQLVSGARKYNIVVRPGDIIRVPVVGSGYVYVGGHIARPGSYNMPPTGRITLLRLIDSAGGLGSLAIPERVDLTRMITPNSQAMIRLNLRAIAEGTQPDVYLKPDDRITIGTNFWAYPLAVIRGGFRASYGFGFLLDRNFGNDVFGAPPGERGF